MCTQEDVRKVVQEELADNNELRNINLKNELEPLKTSIKNLVNLRRDAIIFIAGNIIFIFGVVYFVGGWMSSVTDSISHNAERIQSIRSSDETLPNAFVLDTRLGTCEANIDKTDKKLDAINSKLDRIIESQLNLHG